MNLLLQVDATSSVLAKPHWFVIIIISFAIGLLLRDGVPLFIRYFTSKAHRDPAVGEWHSCHVTHTEQNELVIKRERWILSPCRSKGKLKIDVLDDSGKMKFVSYARSTEGPFCFEVTSSYGETMFHRIKKVFSDQPISMGIWLGVDYRGCTKAAPRVVSREEINDDEFVSIVNRCFESDGEFPHLSMSNSAG